MTEDSKTTVPPDPSIFGRYWMQRDGMDSEDSWDVWRWYPECGCWWAFQSSIDPEYAAEKGWRCVGPALTPAEGLDHG